MCDLSSYSKSHVGYLSLILLIDIKLDSFSFLMDTSYCKEQPKMQEDDARKKEVKEEEAGSRKW
jgi:hypothetical protein